jgi:hypothetical protein
VRPLYGTLVAAIMPVPVAKILAPEPTPIAAEILVELLNELNGVDSVLALLIVTELPVQAPPTSGVQVMLVPGIMLKAEAASGSLNHHSADEDGLLPMLAVCSETYGAPEYVATAPDG